MDRIRGGVRDRGQRWVGLGICKVGDPPPGFHADFELHPLAVCLKAATVFKYWV